MKILLTGWSGTIGHAIYRELLPAHTVLRMGRGPECEIPADFSSRVELASLPTVDAIVHCAGCTDDDFSANSRYGWEKTQNALDLLLRIAREEGAGHFVYFSTAHVYGDLKGTLDETTPPDPRSEYARCHLQAENRLRRDFSGALSLFRPNAVFGFPADWRRFRRWSLIPYAFPMEAVQKQSVTLQSSGVQQRNFCGAGDLARLVERELNRPSVEGVRVINPLGKTTLSVSSFASACAAEATRQTGRACEVILAKANAGSAGFSYHSIWPQQPTDSLHEYLERMTAYAVSQKPRSV